MSIFVELGDDLFMIGPAVASFALYWSTGALQLLIIAAAFAGAFLWTEWVELKAAKEATEKQYKREADQPDQ